MPNKVRFIETTKSKYLSLQSPDSNSLYFITDTQEIYKGDQSLSSAITLPNSSIVNTLEEWKEFIKQFVPCTSLNQSYHVNFLGFQEVGTYPVLTPTGWSLEYFDPVNGYDLISMQVIRYMTEDGQSDIVTSRVVLPVGVLDVYYNASSDSLFGSEWHPSTLQWTEL